MAIISVNDTMKAVHEMVKKLRAAKKTLCTAESCTGGLLAGYITEIPGSSLILERGFVSYSNKSKIELLTVPTYFIEEYGAVSMQTAIAMAEGAILNSHADIAVAITGIAGPEGGSDEKPVGTVFIATSVRNGKSNGQAFVFDGIRSDIRAQAIYAAAEMVFKL